MNFLIPFLIAFIGSKLIFSYFGFNYNTFSDPFDITKVVIDIGVFSALYILGSIVFNKIKKSKES
jgi:hypothetical protein